MVFADEPGERVLVPAPERVDERRFLWAHGEVTHCQARHPAAILPSTQSTAAGRLFDL
jgi:hypothetical protein